MYSVWIRGFGEHAISEPCKRCPFCLGPQYERRPHADSCTPGGGWRACAGPMRKLSAVRMDWYKAVLSSFGCSFYPYAWGFGDNPVVRNPWKTKHNMLISYLHVRNFLSIVFQILVLGWTMSHFNKVCRGKLLCVCDPAHRGSWNRRKHV